MTLNYSDKGKVKIYMREYVNKTVDDLPIKLDENYTAATPSNNKLFENENSNILSKEKAYTFQTITAKGLFLFKIERPDIQPTIASLCSRAKNPNEGDAKRLARMMKYLNGTK